MSVSAEIRIAAVLVALLGAGCESSHTPVACKRACEKVRFDTLDLVAGQPGGEGWVDGVGPAVHFSAPLTFARDGAELLLLDGSVIRTIDPANGEVGTLAGSYAVIGGDDGVGAAASFYQPSGIAAADGVVYVTDTENNTVRKIDVESRRVTTIGGAYGVNGSDDGVGTDARFREPEGLALDLDGILYIADTDNSTIRRMELATGAVTTLAGSPGVIDDADGVGAAALFAKPRALLLDGEGSLYVTDSGNRSLRKVALADATVTTVLTFDVEPTGMAWLGRNLLLSLDQRVVRLDLETMDVSTVAGATNQVGFTDGVGADARFSQVPQGLFLAEDGDLFVADAANYAIRRIDLATEQVTTFAGSSSIGSTDGTGGAARFRSPSGLAVDGDTAYVADTNNHTLRKVVVSSGEVTTLAGAAGQSGNADGDASDARFDQPSGLALDDHAGSLYVADAGNHAIRRLDFAAGVVTTLPVTAARGESFEGFDRPVGLATEDDHLFIADSGKHAVFVLDTESTQIRVLAGTAGVPGATDGKGAQARFYGPGGIAVDGRGNLFVADIANDLIRKIAIATGEVSTVAGARSVQGTVDGVGRAARFAYPSGVAVGGTGELFVADTNNDTMRRIDPETGAVTTVVGMAAVAGVRLGPLPAQLSTPTAPVVTDDGRLLFFSENSLLVAH